MEEELPLIDEPIPEMTHNVFGLDHARIMNRLLAARKKSRDAWVNVDADNPVISYRAPDIKPDDSDVGNQQMELADFLLKRQVNSFIFYSWFFYTIYSFRKGNFISILKMSSPGP